MSLPTLATPSQSAAGAVATPVASRLGRSRPMLAFVPRCCWRSAEQAARIRIARRRSPPQRAATSSASRC